MPKESRAAANVEVNMTPMIDCTFQLLIFFILTTQIANAELAPMVLAEPYKSVAISEETGRSNRVIVNIFNSYGLTTDDRNPDEAAVAQGYIVAGGEAIEVTDLATLKDRLSERRDQAGAMGFDPADFLVEIRCDKDIHYAYVEPVLRAASELEIAKMNVMAIVDPDVAAQAAQD